MDEKFYYVSEGLICPYCKSDEIKTLGTSRENIYKCMNCEVIMFGEELIIDKEENKK